MSLDREDLYGPPRRRRRLRGLPKRKRKSAHDLLKEIERKPLASLGPRKRRAPAKFRTTRREQTTRYKVKTPVLDIERERKEIQEPTENEPSEEKKETTEIQSPES